MKNDNFIKADNEKHTFDILNYKKNKDANY